MDATIIVMVIFLKGHSIRYLLAHEPKILVRFLICEFVMYPDSVIHSIMRNSSLVHITTQSIILVSLCYFGRKSLH